MRRIVLAAIRFYQRHVSPYKGFSCAYHAHTGHASCSTLGYRAVRRKGVLAGLALIRQRTSLCGAVYRHHHHHRSTYPLHRQQGFCDLSCDLPCDAGCELPNLGCNPKACNILSCCDCGGCDWPDRKRRSSQTEKYVYIPPKVRSRVEPAGQ
jgi:putative component of membrane protein insertase Oxa1/YidC/SpoIIIJ protein YidD